MRWHDLVQDVHVGLLDGNAVWVCRWIPTFLRNIPSQSSEPNDPLEHWYLPTSPHDVATQKTNIETQIIYWPNVK